MPPVQPAISDDLRRRIVAIEAAASRAWPTIEREPFNGWVLRCGHAGTRRLNSVQTLAFDPGRDAVVECVTAAERWYGARGLPSCFQLNDAVQPADLDLTLERRGYTVVSPTSVMTANVPPGLGGNTPEIALLPRADARVLRAICDPAWSAEKQRERVDLFARMDEQRVFALIEDDGEPIAGGMCALDGDLAGLFTMRTQPAHRGRGLARAIALGLIAWARERGAQRLYLQVEDDNEPALHLYHALGFSQVYGYHYREKGVRT